MKRLAFWMVVGVVVLSFAGRRHHRVHAGFDGPAPRSYAARPLVVAPSPAPTVAEAKRQPDWFPKDRDVATAPVADAKGRIVLIGSISATEEKARRDLGNRIEVEVTRWLAGDVPIGWKPPAGAIDNLVRDTYVQPVIESLGDVSKDLDEMVTLYRAGARLDISPGSRAQLIAIHDQQVVRDRMLKGGAALVVALVALAAFSGYIRADEATKGFYTNRLRMLAAVGVGAAGVVGYRMLG